MLKKKLLSFCYQRKKQLNWEKVARRKIFHDRQFITNTLFIRHDTMRLATSLLFPHFASVCVCWFFSFNWRNFIFQITWMAGSWRVQIQNRQTFCDCFSCFFFCGWLLSMLLLVSITILHIRFRVTFHAEFEPQYVRMHFLFDSFLSPFASKVLMAFIILLVKIWYRWFWRYVKHLTLQSQWFGAPEEKPKQKHKNPYA